MGAIRVCYGYAAGPTDFGMAWGRSGLRYAMGVPGECLAGSLLWVCCVYAMGLLSPLWECNGHNAMGCHGAGPPWAAHGYAAGVPLTYYWLDYGSTMGLRCLPWVCDGYAMGPCSDPPRVRSAIGRPLVCYRSAMGQPRVC